MFQATRTFQCVIHSLFRNRCWLRARHLVTVLLLLLSPLVATSRAAVVIFGPFAIDPVPSLRRILERVGRLGRLHQRHRQYLFQQ